jgi:hypothetical protein
VWLQSAGEDQQHPEMMLNEERKKRAILGNNGSNKAKKREL